jgi:hypothetical protein
VNYIHLVGHEDVQRAGRNMLDAAQSMQQSSSWTTEALHQHQRFMDDWLMRLEVVLREDREARSQP